jgi:hypothetical protein
MRLSKSVDATLARFNHPPAFMLHSNPTHGDLFFAFGKCALLNRRGIVDRISIIAFQTPFGV